MQNLNVIRENNLTKGYMDKVKPELLPDGFCADAKNCWLDDYSILKRSGYTEKGTDVEIEKPIISQSAAKFSGGANFIIRARDNAAGTNCVVETWDGTGAWDSLAASQTAEKDHSFPIAIDKCYLVNDTDTVLSTANGTSTSEIAAFPNGIDAKWFHNYMFILTAAGRLYWSSLNDPEAYAGADYIDVNPQDGDTAIGLAVLKDELLILKKNRIWSLTGFGASDFTVADMGERLTGFGAQSKKGIVETGDDVYFPTLVGGIPHFTSIRRTQYGELVAGKIISDPIEGTMKGLEYSQFGNTAGGFDGRKIWWSVTDSGTFNNLTLVYDLPTKGWTRHTGINASAWCVSDVSGYPEMYFGEADAVAKTYKLDSSTSDNGTAIDMQFKSRMYGSQPERKSKWKYLYVTCDIDSDASLDIDYSVDGYDFNDLATLSLTGTGGTFPITFDSSRLGTPSMVRERIDSAGGVAQKMQYLFQNNTATDTINIREFEVLYKPKGLRAANEA